MKKIDNVAIKLTALSIGLFLAAFEPHFLFRCLRIFMIFKLFLEVV